MKGPFRNKQGSSLLEIVVAIAVLGLMVAPVCSSLVLSHRLNADSEKLLQARLLVESTVEQLMAEGLVYEMTEGEESFTLVNELPDGVDVQPQEITPDNDNQIKPWYNVAVMVKDTNDEVVVEIDTIIRVASATILSEEGGDAE